MSDVFSGLHPAIREWAERIDELSASLPDLNSADARARRAAERKLSDDLARQFTAPCAPGVHIIDESVRAGARSLRIRRYLPSGIDTPAPTQIALHGGGFVSGTIEELVNDRLLTSRAAGARIQVISLDYRLAPEHPYPAAVDDTIALLDILRTQPERFDVDIERIGIGGASAGGSIAASTTLHLRDRSDDALVHQHLEVPALILSPFGASAEEYAHGFGLEGHERLVDSYVGRARPIPVFAEPLKAPALAGLPPAFIQAAEHDPLRDAALAYAQHLRDAGVAVTAKVGRGHVHGSPSLTATFEPARTWQRRAARMLREAYHPVSH